MLALTSHVFKNTDVAWRIIEDEAILVNVDESEVIHLNPVGTLIWDSIDAKKSVCEIIDHIYDIFEVDKETAQKDTIEFLEKLIEKKLVKCR